MANYLDFSQFNQAAEGVRPTARIQLIQRILNAASIISSLCSGIPLKWASGYKSFQVLKYSENQDPTDVTTSEAVSAVNSILFENRAQVESSNEDMQTLTTELSNISVVGHLSYKSMLKAYIPSDAANVLYASILTPSAGFISLKLSKNGHIMGVSCGNQAAWSALAENAILPQPKGKIPVLITGQDGNGNYTATAIGGTVSDSLVLYKLTLVNNSLEVEVIETFINGASQSGHASVPFTDISAATTMSDVRFTGDSRYQASGPACYSPTIEGTADAREYLGLPDTGPVITALNNLIGA